MRLANPKQEAAAWSLAQDGNQAAAARTANVNRATVGRWVSDDNFSARVDELRIQMSLAGESPEDAAGEAERGLARLVPIAEAVVQAALLGEPYPDESGRIPSATQHARALDTIKLAAQLEPKATSTTGAPSLGSLIAEADARRAGTN